MKRQFVLLAVLSLAVTTTYSQDLEVGDLAPGLDIKSWVQGSTTSLDKGTVYVIEFWSTDDSRSRQLIPALNFLHNVLEGEGLQIIAISDEETEAVQRFVRSQGSRLEYAVAVDNDGASKDQWMEAADQETIPTAFVVDREGEIVYIGPIENREFFENVVRKTLLGRYDPELEREAEPYMDAARQAVDLRNWQQAYYNYNEVIKLDSTVFADVARKKFVTMMVDEHNPKRAYKYANELLTKYAQDTHMLEEMARTIATHPEFTQRDMDLAEKFAQAAIDSAGPNHPSTMDTMALIKYQRGEVQEAIELETRAWMIARPHNKPAYRRALDTYRSTARGGRGQADDSKSTENDN